MKRLDQELYNTVYEKNIPCFLAESIKNLEITKRNKNSLLDCYEEMNYMFYDTTKADWKLFQEKLPIWQEKFMKKLNNEYIQLLTEPKNDAEKFWELEKRIKTDRRKKGVICEMSKSIMVDNIISLIKEDAITLNDLSDFSNELKEYVSFLLKYRNLEGE